jgi:outer membrane immunogenic protein
MNKFTLKALSAALILASATGVASAKGYKGEANYKDAPMAVPCPAPKLLMDGFYLGAQGGYDSYRVRETLSTPGSSSITGTSVLNTTGWVGGLFLGYGQYINRFYLGIEGFGNASNSQQANSTTDLLGTYYSQFQVNSSYGLALLPGVSINDTTLGYLRLGYNWANLKLKETVTGSNGVSKSNTSNGFNLGLGIETLIVDNWSVRTEYSHTYYNSFNTSYGTSVNPSDNQFMLGVLYHF